jgi:hypothetical protein
MAPLNRPIESVKYGLSIGKIWRVSRLIAETKLVWLGGTMPMTLGVRHYFETYHFESLTVRRSVCCASAATVTSVLFAWLLGALFAEPHHDLRASLRPPLSTNLSPYNLFLDSRFDFYFSREIFSKTFSQPSDFQQTAAALSLVTSPSRLTAALSANGEATAVADHLATLRLASTPRPSRQRTPLSLASEAGTQSTETPESPPSDNKNAFQRFFAKLFGRLSPSAVRLASAATDDSQLDAISITSRYDQWTAVYDISAHTVYMPDGTKLEAHSGFGESLDDPAQVDGVNRGPTPPNIYNLVLREQPFHGVRALRLIPVDDQGSLGRTGLLAHSFMLGPDGQSNGCVSFRDYDAFLHAYMSHQVKRLVVVARLD